MNIPDPVLAAIFTVSGAAVTFTLGQIFVKVALEPMQELRKEIGKIAYSLDFYANQVGVRSREPEKVSRVFREHACRLREISAVTALYTEWTALTALPSKKNLFHASSLLIGYSNGVGENDQQRWLDKQEIIRLLNIETEESLRRKNAYRVI